MIQVQTTTTGSGVVKGSTRWNSGEDCRGKSYSARLVAEALIPLTAEVLNNQLGLDSALEEAANEFGKTLVDNQIEERIKAELTQVRKAKSRIVKALGKGIISEVGLKVLKPELNTMSITQLERYRGALLGLAAADAVGTTLEFKPPGTFTPIDDMMGGGPFNLEAGQWTDDTSMALCLAESLIEQKEFDPVDQLKRYARWYRDGYLSSTGHCFDIGNTVRSALHKFERTGEPFCGSTNPNSAGNGSIMRLAPVPLFYAKNPEQAIEQSGQSSRTTHGARAAVDGCRYFGALIVGAVNGAGKEELLSPRYSPVAGYWDKRPLTPEIDTVAQGSFKHRNPPYIKGTGYVVKSLEAALWAFYHSDSFKEGCLLAVNLGDDADTTGAVYGQLAGAFYGVQSMPESWLTKLKYRHLINAMAEKLFTLANNTK